MVFAVCLALEVAAEVCQLENVFEGRFVTGRGQEEKGVRALKDEHAHSQRFLPTPVSLKCDPEVMRRHLSPPRNTSGLSMCQSERGQLCPHDKAPRC